MTGPRCEIRFWRSLSLEQRRAITEKLTDDQLRLLHYELTGQGWWSKAREKQLPPEGDWVYWLLLAGRGWGKTRTGVEWIKHMVAAGYRRGAIVAKDPGEARDVIIEGESGILACTPDWDRPVYTPSKKRLTWPNGAIHTIYSSEGYEELRGPQHDHALVDELAKYRYAVETWDQLMFGLRLKAKGSRGEVLNPQVAITTTPRPTALIRRIRDDPKTVVTVGTTFENLDNLSVTYQQVIARYQGTRLGRQELLAEMLDDNPGALWTYAMIESCRVELMPVESRRRVVAIDPSATEEGNEAGIMVGGLGQDMHGYLLEDRTTRGRPETWARAAIDAYHAWQCDRIVAEGNNGGEMIEAVIKSIDRSVPVKIVTATRGKLTRAEPISAFYEQGRIHHVGTYPELEDEMCTYTVPLPGEPIKPSPNRMDAMVWVFTELMGRGIADINSQTVLLGDRLPIEPQRGDDPRERGGFVYDTLLSSRDFPG